VLDLWSASVIVAGSSPIVRKKKKVDLARSMDGI